MLRFDFDSIIVVGAVAFASALVIAIACLATIDGWGWH